MKSEGGVARGVTCFQRVAGSVKADREDLLVI